MMGLDINTEKGQATLEQEKRAVELFHSGFRQLEYLGSPKDRAANLDALILDRGTREWYSFAETKCRDDMDFEKFTGERGSSWLITWDKIDKARMFAEWNCVPLIGLLYLVPDDMLLIKYLWTPERGWCAHERKTTRTQATVNGGLAIRENAFFDMANAKIVRG